MLGLEFESCTIVCVEVLNANSCCCFSVKCINEPEALGTRTELIPQKVPWDVTRIMQSLCLDVVRLSSTDVCVALRSSPYFQRNWHMLLGNVLFEYHLLIRYKSSITSKASNHYTRMHFINLTPVQLAQQKRLGYIPDLPLCREKNYLLKVYYLSSLKSLTPNPLKISRKPPGGFNEFSMRAWQERFYILPATLPPLGFKYRVCHRVSDSRSPIVGQDFPFLAAHKGMFIQTRLARIMVMGKMVLNSC